MAVHVKICGIASVEAADAVLRAGADFAGLVFHPRSPRRVSPMQAAELATRVRARVRVVALFADPEDEEVAAAVASCRPDFLQLHGQESVARVGALRSRFGKPVIKAVAIAEPADLSAVAAYETVADMFLFDAKAPANATREGGHGASFDWQLLHGRRFARPWLLAGGLTPQNVARAIRISGASGVDVSSGVESAPGNKCPNLISAFVVAARTAQSQAESLT